MAVAENISLSDVSNPHSTPVATPEAVQDVERANTVQAVVVVAPGSPLTVTAERTSMDPRVRAKIASVTLAFFVAGVNDGSLGALVSYIIAGYGITTGYVSVFYGTTFAGWLVAAGLGGYVRLRLRLGGTLALGAALYLFGQLLRFWDPPFGLFAVTFFFTALGQAFQDAQGNTFVSGLDNAHRWLGLIHGCYGFGCMTGPLVAAAVSSKTTTQWARFYYFPSGLGVINLVLALWAFRDDLVKTESIGIETTRHPPHHHAKDAVMEMKMASKNRAVWLVSLFLFFYLGVAITIGGWLVPYLVIVRKDTLSQVDYIPTGFYGGIALGRLVLAEPTHRLGERRMIFAYTLVCLALQIVFWRVDNIIASGVIVSIMGFFLGPFFASAMSVSTKILPPEIHTPALGLIFVAAQLGGNAFPALTGVIAEKAGVGALQPLLVGLIVALAASWAVVPSVKLQQE